MPPYVLPVNRLECRGLTYDVDVLLGESSRALRRIPLEMAASLSRRFRGPSFTHTHLNVYTPRNFSHYASNDVLSAWVDSAHAPSVQRDKDVSIPLPVVTF